MDNSVRIVGIAMIVTFVSVALAILGICLGGWNFTRGLCLVLTLICSCLTTLAYYKGKNASSQPSQEGDNDESSAPRKDSPLT